MSSQSSPQFSIDKDASLFGLDVEHKEHFSKLEAANIFSQVRKDLVRNANTLETLKPGDFARRRTKHLFKENVTLVMKGEPGSRIILPLVDKLSDSENNSVLNIFILACFTVTKTTRANIEKSKLTDVFADFLLRIFNDCAIFSDMRKILINIIKDVCQENNSNETSKRLLGTFSIFSVYTSANILRCR